MRASGQLATWSTKSMMCYPSFEREGGGALTDALISISKAAKHGRTICGDIPASVLGRRVYNNVSDEV